MSRSYLRELLFNGVEPKRLPILSRKPGRHDEGSVIGKRDIALVEKGIHAGFEQEAVVGIHALRVRAVLPRLRVAGTQQRRYGNPDQGAFAIPHLFQS